ncbi:3-methyladenine DNA glycosylase [Nocardioides sp. 503]|uniref:3-methyladenine DNA glycosylase n=1 Tax=Nocardioides sp. 503 TaxID=2508326 RepID=UPI00107042DA|nr:3-methyladenine DNA glycosylase [Nocardioides sp. 503]
MTQVLDEATWRARAAAHAERVDAFVRPHLERRGASVKHPVHDFLFTYYSQRPAQLRRWHPGFGVALEDAEEYATLKGYASGVEEVAQQPSRHPVTVSAAFVESQRPLVESIHALLTATAGRPANFGCFGMHEWAMVYRLEEDETRHADWPLRLGAEGTDRVVESHKVACSHFDAFRFFTPQARPLNTLSPGRDDRPSFEQPACLHAGMDLYKHAFRLTPMIGSDLVADCFELARDIRELDMRAAPYDFTGITMDHTGEEWTPVKIETPEGKQEYVAAQKQFSERGQVIRRALVKQCERLLPVH